MADTPDQNDEAKTALPPPLKVIVSTLALRKRVHRPDYTDSGDTPVEPPRLPGGGEDYLPAVRELVDRIVERYGGRDEFERFVSSHLDGLPADASVATLAGHGLRNLENAILANDVFGAIAATVDIERVLASPWTGFDRSTGYKSGQTRKYNNVAAKRAQYDAIKREVERLQQENRRLTRDKAIERAAKEFGRSRAWFYRWKKSFGDP